GDDAGLALGIFNSPFTFIYRGGAAVMLFFLLSGFVLTLACIHKAPSNRHYVSAAASKRYLRLGLPVAAAIALGYAAITANLFPSAPDGVSPFFDFPDMDLGLADMVKAALYKSMLFGDRDFDYVLWTISIEFYGSLLVFGAYALMGRHRMPAMVLSALTGLALLGFERPAALYGLFFLG